MKRFFTLIALAVICLVSSEALAVRKYITLSKSAFAWGNYPVATVEDTLTDQVADTLIITVPDNMDVERFTPFVYIREFTNAVHTLRVHYRPLPGMKVSVRGAIVNLDLSTGSAPIPISWRQTDGSVDTLITMAAATDSALFFPYVPISSASSEQDEFRPPSSTVWEWVYARTTDGDNDSCSVTFLFHWRTK